MVPQIVVIILFFFNIAFNKPLPRLVSWPNGVKSGDCLTLPCKNLEYVFEEVLKRDKDETIIILSSEIPVDQNLVFHTSHSLQIMSTNTTMLFRGSSIEIESKNRHNEPVLNEVKIVDDIENQCRHGRHFLLNISSGYISNVRFEKMNPERCFNDDLFFIGSERIENSNFDLITNWTYPYLLRTKSFVSSSLVNVLQYKGTSNIFGKYEPIFKDCEIRNCGTLKFTNFDLNYNGGTVADTLFIIEDKSLMTLEDITFHGISSFTIKSSSTLDASNINVENVKMPANGSPFMDVKDSDLQIENSVFSNLNGPVMRLKKSKGIIIESTFKKFEHKYTRSVIYIEDGQLDVAKSKFLGVDNLKYFIECVTSKGEKCDMIFDLETEISPYISGMECDINCQINGEYCDIFVESHRQVTYEWVLGLLFIIGLGVISAICLCITFWKQFTECLRMVLSKCRESRQDYLTPLL